jgi:hypothetical protein
MPEIISRDGEEVLAIDATKQLNVEDFASKLSQPEYREEL